jgi:hypothetical protein
MVGGGADTTKGTTRPTTTPPSNIRRGRERLSEVMTFTVVHENGADLMLLILPRPYAVYSGNDTVGCRSKPCLMS